MQCSLDTNYPHVKCVARGFAPDSEFPSDLALSLFILPPRAQASRRCETQAPLKAASRLAPLAFRSLDPFRALRTPDCRRRDEERPLPLRTKNWHSELEELRALDPPGGYGRD